MKSSRPTTYPHPGAVLPPAQGGLGLIGFLATAVPVIWLGLGGVELAHWMQLRQSLSLILMDAARVGATRSIVWKISRMAALRPMTLSN